MKKAGYKRTLVQCHNKIKKLKGDYRKIINKRGTIRRKKSFMKRYEMSIKHSVTPSFILDTSVESSNTESNVDGVKKIPDIEDENSLLNEEVNKPSKDGEVTAALVATEKSSEKDVKPQITGTKRKKSVKIDKMEKVIDKMCEKISSQQAESDHVHAEPE